MAILIRYQVYKKIPLEVIKKLLSKMFMGTFSSFKKAGLIVRIIFGISVHLVLPEPGNNITVVW